MSSRRAKRLWVIDPSLVHAEDEGVREILADWPGHSRLFRPVLDGGGPDVGTGYDTDGVVLMGSRASVHEGAGWLHGLSDWIAPLLDGSVQIPLLGICFGHQLLAQRAGGRVGFVDADRRKRLGVATTVLTGSRLLPGRHELRVVVSHREEVKSLPDGYRVVARRGDIEIDGLEHTVLPIHSFQFHPEARGEFARHAGIDPREIAPEVREDSRRLLAAFRGAVLAGA